MKQPINEIKRMQQLAGIIKEGETKVMSGFKYFTDKDEWQEAIDKVFEKIKSVFPGKDVIHSRTIGNKTSYSLGKGMGAVYLGGWDSSEDGGYQDRGVRYPGTVNQNYLGVDLVYPDGSRKD